MRLDGVVESGGIAGCGDCLVVVAGRVGRGGIAGCLWGGQGLGGWGGLVAFEEEGRREFGVRRKKRGFGHSAAPSDWSTMIPVALDVSNQLHLR